MAVKTLLPADEGFYQEIGAITGAATSWEALRDTNHNTYTTPDVGGSPPDTARETYKFDEIPADVPGTTPVAKVEVFYEPLTTGGFPTKAGMHVYLMARHASTDIFSADLAPVTDAGPGGIGALGIKSWEPAENPDTTPWTVADFQGASRAEFGVRVIMDAGSQSTVPSDAKLWLIVTYQAIVPSYDAGREVGGRMLRLRRRLLRTYTVTAPLWLLDAELGDDLTMDAYLAEDPAGGGWLQKLWQRGWLKITRIATNFSENNLTLTLLWMREYAALWWDTMCSESPAGIYGQGVARLSLGEKRTFARASAAWINSSGQARGALYYLAVDDVEKVTALGTIFMAARTNKLLHSSFIQGVVPAATGWTYEGTGGGNTVAAEEIAAGGVTPLFERQVGARRVKIVKGTAADVQARNTTLMSVTDVTGWATFAHLDADATKPMKWAARKIITGGSVPGTYWWNDAGQTWGSAGGAKVWNALTGSATSVKIEHFKIPIGSLGGGTATLELMMGVDSAASNRTCYGYHASWIEGAYLSDELIVTTTATYTVQTDSLQVENNSGTPSEVRRIFPSSAVTVYFQFQTFWSAADVTAGGVRVVFNNRWDVNNSILLFWNKDTGQLIARYRRTGTAYDATKTLSVVAGTVYAGAIRIIGAGGELDMTAYTVSLFVDGVKGSDASPPGAITMTSTGALWLGSDQNANHLDGRLKHFEITHEVLSDLEITGKP